VLLLLAGTVGSALALPACASAGPATWTSPRPALVPVAMIPDAARQVTLSMKYGANAKGRKPPSPVTAAQDGQSAAALRLASRQARIAAIGEQ
jgi:hypothetical protein